MAKGYPDFFGFSFFPFNGPLIQVTNDGTITANQTVDVLSVAGKGISFFGLIQCETSLLSSEVRLTMTIDGETSFVYPIQVAGAGINTYGNRLPVQIVHQDREGPSITYEILHGMTFASSFVVSITEASGTGTIVYHARFGYQSITT